MSKHAPQVPAEPKKWVKWVVSLLVLAHFGAIVTAVTSAGGGQFQPPELAVRSFIAAKPYLRFLFLTNAYRFYAPDPGATSLAWFRLEYQDGSIRWIEFPRQGDYWGRMPYQRRLCIPMLLASNLIPHPQNPALRIVGDLSQAYASSYARFVARTQDWGYIYPDGRRESSPLAEVQIFLVEHGIPNPREVQAGWKSNELRTYRPLYLGRFAADGKVLNLPEDLRSLNLRVIVPPIASLTERILKEEVYPILKEDSARDPAEVIASLRLPPVLESFLRENPDLLDAKLSDENLEPRIRESARIPEDPVFVQ